MKTVRIICLLIACLLAIYPLSTVLAQEQKEEALYALSLTPTTGLYNERATVGRDNHFAVEVKNVGTATSNNITFSSDIPEGWTIKFTPDKVDLLGALDYKLIDVTIKLPSETRDGDYMVTLRASGKETSAKEIDMRVTVESLTFVEKIELKALYPKLEAIAGEDFVFEVEFRYDGSEVLDFNLLTTAPPGWSVYMTPPYEKDKKVSAIRLKPAFTLGDKLRLVATAPFWPLPEPGEYKITLEAVEAVSGKLKASTELKGIITAKYFLALAPATQRYDTTATAGRDNFFSIEVGNLGTAAIDNIALSSDKPEGWTIDFTPEKVDSVEAIDKQTVDVNIKPPPETIAGDYMITLRASGKQAGAQELNIRVTVETPTIWGWVGVGIILLVIVGLVVIFMRFSRR